MSKHSSIIHGKSIVYSIIYNIYIYINYIYIYIVHNNYILCITLLYYLYIVQGYIYTEFPFAMESEDRGVAGKGAEWSSWIKRVMSQDQRQTASWARDHTGSNHYSLVLQHDG